MKVQWLQKVRGLPYLLAPKGKHLQHNYCIEWVALYESHQNSLLYRRIQSLHRMSALYETHQNIPAYITYVSYDTYCVFEKPSDQFFCLIVMSH
jgi:hypothetical protein